MNDKTKGYLLGAIAAATYGCNPLFALPLYSLGGMDVDSVLLWRYMLAIPVIGVMLLWRGRWHQLRVTGRQSALLMVMGVLMAGSSLTLFLSYNYMDSGVASTLLFVYPVMVALIMALLFGERLARATIVCIVVALVGIVLLNHTTSGGVLSPLGVTLVMVSALTYAVYIVWINRAPLRSVASLVVIFYVLVFGAILFAGRIFLTGGSLQVPAQGWLWVCVLGLAVLPTAVSFICTTRAITYIGPTPTAILGALEPVVAVIFAVTIFGDLLTLRQVVGIALIVGAVMGVIAGGKITVPLTRFRHMFPSLRSRLRR